MSNIIEMFAEKLSEQKMNFIKEIVPHREDLFNYCKSVSATIWESEDLVQDTILIGFAKIPETQGNYGDTLSYLKKIASKICLQTKYKLHSNEIAVAYANAFNNKNIDEMVSLLSENAIYEVKGVVEEHGVEAIIAGSWMHAQQVEMRSEVVMFNDEYIVLRFTINKEGVEKMSGILRITEEDSKIVRVEDYFFSPEVLAHVGKELKLDYKTNGHHWAV